VTPLVLVPGMMCDARLWQAVIGPLSARRSVLCAWIGGQDTVEAMAAAVLAAAPPRFALAGLSLGGIVAMAVLRLAPERVERLALMDTNPFAETEALRARRAPQVARVTGGALADVMRDELIPRYVDDGPEADAIRALCLAMALGLGPGVFARQSAALATRPDAREVLAAYAGPALVLTGAADRLCPMDRHTAMHGLLRRSRLAVIEGAGHLPVLEQPEPTLAALEAWLG
jgi:pimeloyl-ACP methyl ester carboxylesterase